MLAIPAPKLMVGATSFRKMPCLIRARNCFPTPTWLSAFLAQGRRGEPKLASSGQPELGAWSGAGPMQYECCSRNACCGSLQKTAILAPGMIAREGRSRDLFENAVRMDGSLVGQVGGWAGSDASQCQ